MARSRSRRDDDDSDLEDDAPRETRRRKRRGPSADDICPRCGGEVHRVRPCEGCKARLCSDVCYNEHTKECPQFQGRKNMPAVIGCLILAGGCLFMAAIGKLFGH